MVDHLVLRQLLPCTCPPLKEGDRLSLKKVLISSFEDVLHGKELGVGEIGGIGGSGRGSVIPSSSSVQSIPIPICKSRKEEKGKIC